MPYSIKFDMPPAGVAASSGRKGDLVEIKSMEFTSTEDGQDFIRRLEGFAGDILDLLKPQKHIKPSEVDHMLAVIDKTGAAVVYVNEINTTMGVRINRPCKAGDAIHKSDIVEIDRVELSDIKIPATSGVIYLFSLGWRKGLFFDFQPLAPDGTERDYDCAKLFGHLMGYVLFQERFAISETEWQGLFSSQLFPFAALDPRSVDQLLQHIRAGWDPDELTEVLHDQVLSKLDDFLNAWKNHAAFTDHMPLLTHAAERFREKDFISCCAILYPRIEGLLRTHLRMKNPAAKATQLQMAGSAVSAKRRSAYSLLLPLRFENYLNGVYFANFEPADQKIDISRNSVGHGVAHHESFSMKAATISLLVAHQLFYCFEV